MEKYRNVIQQRVSVYTGYCGVLLLVNIGMNTLFKGNHFSNFVSGLTIAFQLFFIFRIGMYYKALKDDKTLLTLHIQETDERKQYIKTKSQSTGLQVFLMAMVIAMIIASFFNTTVFVTLFATCIVCCVLTMVCKLYYSTHI